MRVMIVNGSPRKGGYTAELVERFSNGVASAKGTVETVRLCEKKIAPCVGCFKCWVDHPGKCVFSDDMEGILETYLRSDVIVLATPTYYFSFSALMKIFFERLFPTCKPGLDMGGALGLGRNKARFPDKGPQKAVLIATCALRNPRTLSALLGTFDLVCDAIGAFPVGRLIRPESNLLDFEQAKPRTIRRIRRAFETAGDELVRHGAISKACEQAARLSITSSDELFSTHFETYWTIASEMDSAWTDRELLADTANKDPRIVMRELASYYNPKADNELDAVIQLNLTDATTYPSWQLVISDGACRAVEGPHPSADLTMTMSQAVFNDLVLQRVSAPSAFSRRLISTEGSRELLARFSRLFQRRS